MRDRNVAKQILIKFRNWNLGCYNLQYLAKNQPTQRCQSLITQGSDHPPVLEPHMVLISNTRTLITVPLQGHGALSFLDISHPLSS
jgi:hypothetical protein